MVELNGAHESAVNADKSRALLAKQVAELQGQLEDAEAAGGKGLKNQIRKLEQRVRDHPVKTYWVPGPGQGVAKTFFREIKGG